MRRLKSKPLLWFYATFFLIVISANALAQESLDEVVFPLMDGARIHHQKPKITISLERIEGSDQWASLRLLVDDVDVSAFVVVGDRVVNYSPRGDLEYGKHTITLETMDEKGTILSPLTWHFTVPRSELFDKASARVLVDAQSDLQLAAKENSEEPEWAVQSNATLNSVMETGYLKVSLDANVWYADQEKNEPTGDKFNLNNYLLDIYYREQRLAAGDLTVAGTELISPSIARRGGLMELSFARTKALGFLLQSNQLTGFDHAVELDNPDQRLMGGSLEQKWESAGNLIIKGTALTGKNQDPGGYNTGTVASPSNGQMYTLQVNASPLDEKLGLTGEFGVSRFDEDTSDAFGYNHGKAWLARFTSRMGSYDYGGGYKHLGRHFRSIVDTSAMDNREEYSLYGTKTFEESSLTAGGSTFLDNVEEDPLLPVVRNTSLDIAYNVFKANWPMLFFNSNLVYQASSDEPANMDDIENFTQTFTGGLALVREKWNLSPSYTYSRLEDDSVADSDSQTHQASLIAGIQPTTSVSLSPSLSWSRTDSGDVVPVTSTLQGTLAGTYLFSPMHDFYLTLSAIDTDTDDNSAHTTTYDSICQYNWHPETRFLQQVRKTISLRGRYNHTHDRIGEDSLEDYALSVMVSIGGLPVMLY
ncbi:MAG: hypothetical protein FP816_06290 [Desulfobacteraceae bacterium]|nr:hypothetical protein [Desulfobacteraceae bacterium]